MFRPVLLVVCLSFLGTFSADEIDVAGVKPTVIPPHPVTTPAPSSSSLAPSTTPDGNKTTVAPPTTPSTPAPPETTTPTIPTTPQSNTTTAAPTTPVPTTPSTPAPITPSTPAPTTPSPAPTPAPKALPWHVTDNATQFVCILASMDISIDIPYNTTENKEKWAKVTVPKNATASGICGVVNQTLVLNWEQNKIQFNFTANSTQKHYWLSSIRASVVPDDHTFPNISDLPKEIVLSQDGIEFVAPLNNTYKCKAMLQLNSAVSTGTQTARMSFSNLQLDAFHHSKNVTFSDKSIVCDSDERADIVPIVVGCALAGLVVVVLIAYLVGRRRSQARGYLSM